MHCSKHGLPILFDAPSRIQGAEWGSLLAISVSLPAGFDLKPLLKGLPEDLCQCPHWGYLLSGKIRVTYADEVETVEAGEFFYFPPGHSVKVEDTAEFVEFSPTIEYKQTIEAIVRNSR
jgi:hypothetical protein